MRSGEAFRLVFLTRARCSCQLLFYTAVQIGVTLMRVMRCVFNAVHTNFASLIQIAAPFSKSRRQPAYLQHPSVSGLYCGRKTACTCDIQGV